MQIRFLGLVRKHAEFDPVPHNVIRNVAAQRALHRDLNHRMQPPEFRHHRQQVKHGKLVGRNHEFSFLQLAQFGKGFRRLAAEIDQFFRIFIKNLARISQHALARGPVEERLALFR